VKPSDFASPNALDLIGKPKTALDTPALLVDLALLDQNIQRIADTCRKHGVRWRPHIKGQKVPQLAERAFTAGARGITCAKLGEAEIMASAGIDDILIANQIASGAKIERLMRLLRTTRVTIAVDNPDNVAALGRSAQAHGVTANVLIELDVGMKRAGVLPGQPAVALAEIIALTPGLHLAGVMAWEGHAARVEDAAEKVRMIHQAVGSLVATADAIRQRGIPIEIVSCGGTGTYPVTAAIPGITEIQAGGGVFSDVAYRTLYKIDHPCALTILTTVTSRPTPTRIVCDAGKKSMSSDAAVPQPIGVGEVASARLSAEHGIVEMKSASQLPRVGDTLEWLVGYSDTTVHLHEEMYALRDGKVEAVWPVVARGKVR
jgi:D-serine deaminase-like pyridoxal phosphate-dependent protein